MLNHVLNPRNLATRIWAYTPSPLVFRGEKTGKFERSIYPTALPTCQKVSACRHGTGMNLWSGHRFFYLLVKLSMRLIYIIDKIHEQV